MRPPQEHQPPGKRARGAAERVTHRLVVRRRLPPPFAAAAIYVSTEGGLRYLRPRLRGVDPALLRLAAELVRPGHVVWDIGANLGLFSFAAAAASGSAGRVLAVEPDAALVSLLRRSAVHSLRRSGAGARPCASVEVLPVAIADDLAVATFNIAQRSRATSHLDGFGTTQTGGVRTTELVLSVTLDWLATRFLPPDIVKIDVEGAEAVVLAGAEQVLREHPVIICEVARRNSDAVGQVLTGYGYTLYDGDVPQRYRVPLTLAPPNTLAVWQAPAGPPPGSRPDAPPAGGHDAS
jgi:FkbM family methyltransferase